MTRDKNCSTTGSTSAVHLILIQTYAYTYIQVHSAAMASTFTDAVNALIALCDIISYNC